MATRVRRRTQAELLEMHLRRLQIRLNRLERQFRQHAPDAFAVPERPDKPVRASVPRSEPADGTGNVVRLRPPERVNRKQQRIIDYMRGFADDNDNEALIVRTAKRFPKLTVPELGDAIRAMIEQFDARRASNQPDPPLFVGLRTAWHIPAPKVRERTDGEPDGRPAAWEIRSR